MKIRYLAISCGDIFLTSRHNDLTSQHRVLTSRHNYLTSDGRNMPPYIISLHIVFVSVNEISRFLSEAG